MWLFSHFIKNAASSCLAARLSSKTKPSTALDNERLHSYFEVVNFLLANYGTKDDIARAEKELESYR